MPSASGNPPTPDTAHNWDRLLLAIQPASLLVVIQQWLGPSVRRWFTAEDVWQETLLLAWRDRERMPAGDPGVRRRWFLHLAKNRVLDLHGQIGAQKRGGGQERRIADLAPSDASSVSLYAGPIAATTPSQALRDRELAEQMHAALLDVPDEWRDVVRLRVLEDLPLADVCRELGISEETARYRCRRGLEVYRRRLLALRDSTSRRLGSDSA